MIDFLLLNFRWNRKSMHADRSNRSICPRQLSSNKDTKFHQKNIKGNFNSDIAYSEYVIENLTVKI